MGERAWLTRKNQGFKFENRINSATQWETDIQQQLWKGSVSSCQIQCVCNKPVMSKPTWCNNIVLLRKQIKDEALHPQYSGSCLTWHFNDVCLVFHKCGQNDLHFLNIKLLKPPESLAKVCRTFLPSFFLSFERQSEVLILCLLLSYTFFKHNFSCDESLKKCWNKQQSINCRW